VIEAVLLNLLATAIWELGLDPLLRPQTRLEAPHPSSDEARDRYHDAVRIAIEGLSALETGGSLGEADVAELLGSAEVRALIRSMYLFRLDTSTGAPPAAQQDFERMASAAGAAPADGELIFQTLLTAVENSLDAALAEGVLSAHEARSAARHHVAVDHLTALDRKLDLLRQGSAPSQPDVSRVEQHLCDEAIARHGTITPPDFYASPRVAIDRLYVPPHLISPKHSEEDEPPRLAASDWTATISRSVILGNPGGGKSTLAKKLCSALADKEPGWQVRGRWLTPVLVVLRDYATAKRDRGHSIAGSIEALASSSYQIEERPTRSVLAS